MMDDSDLDFVNLCSKLLKRVRKKPDEPQPAEKTEHHGASQSSDGEKRRRRNPKKDAVSGRKLAATQPASRGGEQWEVGGNSGRDSGDAGPSSAAPAAAGERTGADRGPRAKDAVLQRMQQFRRDTRQKLVHREPIQPRSNEEDCSVTLQQGGDAHSFSSALQTRDSDEVLALRLQQELDRESAQAHVVDLEDGGLFFCQICQKDLSHMTAEGRTQHLNRCLDESEGGAPAPAPTSNLPDCPICGKRFKSQKSRSAHLKRCSSDMGVSPAVLLQALQRQAEESQNVATANTHTQTVSSKRRGPAKQVPPARKKPRKGPEPPDEETMVALALSSSLLELKREEERLLQPEHAASSSSVSTALRWHQDTGKGRGKRRKGGVPRPPPLLLVQDAEAAVTRLQERVAALLLRSRPPSPPTPTRCPSTLPAWKGAAPLWQKSTLLDGGSTGLSEFYSAELREFFITPELVTNDVISSSHLQQSVQPVRDDTPISKARASLLPSSSRTAPSSPAPSTPGSGQLLVGSQALRDLMELAEDGMTLTQCGYNKKDQQISTGQPTNLRLSGFVQESEEEEAADLCMSGFLPERLPRQLEDTHGPAVRAAEQRRDNEGSHKSVALRRLASDLSSMVNNPQLSDVQLQVDSGEVFFAHSLMVYARCPLLAEMVHESGFGVQEEGVPAAQRVLLSDVPGEAVFALLQYLYTARCSVPASLQPDVLELASRFDLQELQQLCRLQRDEASSVDSDKNVNAHTDEAFTELLRSMWNEGEEEEDDDDGMDSDEGRGMERQLEDDGGLDDVGSEDREIGEERVNEQELEEIYEFAATQRKREEKDSEEEEEEMEARAEDEGEDGESVFTKPKGDVHEEKLQPGSSQRRPDPSLDRSYDRLFSQSVGVYEDGDFSPAETRPPPSKPHQSPHKPTSELSCRTLLQSSVDNLSLGSPPSLSSLPVPGLSPGHVGGDTGGDAIERDVLNEDDLIRGASRGPRSIGAPLAPGASQRNQEPELIVLSDSSEETEADVAVLTSCGPSPPSPFVVHEPLSYTEIKSRQNAASHEPAAGSDAAGSLNPSPGDPADCSPEVSWLIPSTPLPPRRSTTSSSSTQTNSSMCRARLFPKVEASPPSSPDFPSPASPLKRGSSGLVPTEETIFKPGTGRSSGSELSSSPTKNCSHDASKHKDTLAPSNQDSCLLGPSRSSFAPALFRLDPPLHLQAQPQSSTPLHTELRPPPISLSASLLHNHAGEQKSQSETSDKAPSESLDKTELGSFHLSPLSEPSDPRPPHRDLQQRRSTSSNQSPGTSKSRGTGCDSRERADGGTGEEDAAESSSQNSFLLEDEPPIAFNDSWGLDDPGCFSLRLEDSGPSSAGQQTPARSSSSSVSQQPLPSRPVGGSVTTPSPVKGPRSASSLEPLPGPSSSPSPPDTNTRATPELDKDLLDSKIWDSWEGGDEEEEEEEALPLSQRMNPSAHLKTPKAPNKKRRRTLVPITPMPHYSDMETPELKNKLNRFGVRPLPKRQMILKLKEIHQYTHQLLSSDSEDETLSAGCAARPRPPPTRPGSSAQAAQFKEPRAPTAPAAPSPVKQPRVEEEQEEEEPLSASQGSNTSSTAASEESERSNPELCASSSDSDAGVSSSQAASRLQERLRAVRAFILSDAELYSRILRYKPLVLSQFQERLKAAGIRLGAARLVDYLDSQCITFTTAAPGRRRGGQRNRRGAGAGHRGGAKRKKGSSSGN